MMVYWVKTHHLVFDSKDLSKRRELFTGEVEETKKDEPDERKRKKKKEVVNL